MDTPLVSICCLVYNHEPFLRECFEGFVMQKTTFPIEVLVHDDASTDHSADIIREYTEKYPDIFKPIYQTENQYSKGKGFVGLQINFERAQGKYIAMCEGDDYWTDPLKLQKQVDFMDENDEFVLCFHDRDICHETLGFYQESVKPAKDIWQENEVVNLFIPTQTVLFRNINNIIPKGCDSIDIVIWMSLSRYGKTKFMNFNGAIYRIHSGGTWNGATELKRHTLTINALRSCFWNMPNIDRKCVAELLVKSLFLRFSFGIETSKYRTVFFDFLTIAFFSMFLCNLDGIRQCKWFLKDRFRINKI